METLIFIKFQLEKNLRSSESLCATEIFFLFLIFILAAPGLSCGTWDL